MSTTHRALVRFCRGERWGLFVALLGVPGSQWPEYAFTPGRQVPTRAERARALAELGYALAASDSDYGWEWLEDSDAPHNLDSPVQLFAAADVKEVA